MKFTFLLWAIFFSYGQSTLHAQSHVPSFEHRYQQARKKCFDVSKYDKSNFSFAASQEYGVEGLAAITGKISLSLRSGLVYAVQTIKDRMSINPLSIPEAALNLVTSETRDFAADHQLDHLSRACLATCMSSEMLVTDTSFFAHHTDYVANVCYNGRGACYQYSLLADHLARAMDVTSKIIFDDKHFEVNHVYVQYEINNKKYYSETTVNYRTDCHFYVHE